MFFINFLYKSWMHLINDQTSNKLTQFEQFVFTLKKLLSSRRILATLINFNMYFLWTIRTSWQKNNPAHSLGQSTESRVLKSILQEHWWHYIMTPQNYVFTMIMGHQIRVIHQVVFCHYILVLCFFIVWHSDPALLASPWHWF